jgi:Ethanolamine utilization protein EutJ (predicted chaperonin)
MAEEVTTSETVKKTSDGMVKISLEKYEELNRKANEPKVYPNYTTVQKTAAMQAADNKMYGCLWMGGGVSMVLIGAIQFAVGVRQGKAL